jgi:hypothetical protein
MSEWLYNGEPFEVIPKGSFGFVYLITNLLDGRMYIGRKYFYSMTKVKGKKNRVKSESNWKVYCGSCKPLLEDIKTHGLDNFKREILSIHNTKGQVNYNEVAQQFIRNVLYSTNDNGTRIYYNDNILGRYFSKNK